ncbi:hypothetical protein BDQ17DRAFT_1341288 [Cyathus striatus]|nr:hypothetical protein BDQ17DRAFT_1341288 [Cyathus striatus]
MADTATAIKKDIKLWERSFRANNGRDPTISDIKQLPSIAEKYKLYKRLSKQNHSQSLPSTSSLSPPSDLTLPNYGESRSSVLSCARNVKQTVPLSSYNPFSPKKKGTVPSHDKPGVSSPNRIRMLRSPSPNPFSAAQEAQSLVLHLPPVTPIKDNAMSRAKKRLRGEPVSPTPNKEKRRRVESRAGLSRLPLSLNSPESDEHSMEEDAAPRAVAIDDSPVKKSGQGRFFRQLFNDKVSAISVAPLHEAPSPYVDHSAGSVEMYSEEYLHSNESKVGRREDPNPSDIHIPSKEKLLPPSPPNVSRRRPGNANEGYKSKAMLISKDPAGELEQDENSDTGGDAQGGQFKVKLLGSKGGRYSRRLNTISDDEDLPDVKSEVPLGHDMPHGSHEGITSMQLDRSESDLPNTLLRVLVLQPDDSKTQSRQEEQIVRSLISGSRVLHYDPRRGGEIWGVGEDDNETVEFMDLKDAQDTDDWEDEPVPWEVGEL